MIDMNIIRSDPEGARRRISDRSYDATIIDKILELDNERKAGARELEQAHFNRRDLARQRTGFHAHENEERSRAVSRRVRELETTIALREIEIRKLQLLLPNLADVSVPIGA